MDEEEEEEEVENSRKKSSDGETYQMPLPRKCVCHFDYKT